MMESKWLIITAVVGVTALLVGVIVGAVFGFASTLPQIQRLTDENDELRLQYENLNATYTWLKGHSFTYYTVGDAINISNLEVTYGYYSLPVKGNITNISDKPIETVYVYVILRNPDGTTNFSTYNYEEIKNLYVGETAPFSVTIWDYDESQTVEIFLVY